MTYERLMDKPVYKYFYEINQIPRESGNEKAISNYLKKFAEDRRLYVRQDEFNNILIKKPGTKGYETKDAVIIQGHMDMVCVKENDSDHDFSKDPIRMYVVGDDIRAKGTTLGADNGIAVAMGLALIDSKDIPHPPLELIVTTDEEVGLTGAIKMDVTDVDGKYFLNLDSEEEGEFTVSCAGGIRVYLKQNLKYDKVSNENYLVKDIVIKDLIGGHSGVEIDTNRANANKLLGRVLFEISEEIDFSLMDVHGGIKDNVIPSYAKARIVMNPSKETSLMRILQDIEKKVVDEYKTSDKDIKVICEPVTLQDDMLKIFRKQTSEDLICLLMNLPNGIQTMSQDIKDLVESSLNLGVVSISNDQIVYESALRSSVKSYKYYMVNQLRLFAKKFNLEFETMGDYPSWPLVVNSHLEQVCCSLYREMHDKEAVVKGIHAGLECGVFLEKLPDIQAISIGPDMSEVHSPNERVSVSSIDRVFEFVQKVLISL